MVQHALRLGADPNKIVPGKGWSALHEAASIDYEKALRFLLECGGSVKTLDCYRATALHVAAAAGSLACVQLLVKRNADIEARCRQDWTPMAAAMSNGHEYIVRYLHDRGAKVDFLSGNGSVLHIAASKNLHEITQELLDRGADVDISAEGGLTPLYMAALCRCSEVMSVLLKGGADANAKNSSGCTPLDAAVSISPIHGLLPRVEQVKRLLEHGATFSHMDPLKLVCACHNAIVDGDKELVEVFLTNGCNANGQATSHPTLLGTAALHGQIKIGKLLLDHGACMETPPAALMIALCNNQRKFVDFLLSREADPAVLGPNGRNCIQVIAFGDQLDHPSKKEMIRILYRHGVSVDMACDQFGNTALHQASETGRSDCIRSLLNLSANVNAKNNNGMTPIMLACQKAMVEAAQILLESGKVDLQCKANDDSHVLFQAVEVECKALLKLLLRARAPISLAGPNGITPLELAMSKSNAAIVRMLHDAANPDSSRLQKVQNHLLGLFQIGTTQHGQLQFVGRNRLLEILFLCIFVFGVFLAYITTKRT